MIVPFDYTQFKASVDAGKPIQLCDRKGNDVFFPDIKAACGRTRICAVHRNEITHWDTDGFYLNVGESDNDLMMIAEDEPQRDSLDEFWKHFCNSGASDEVMKFVLNEIEMFVAQRERGVR